MSLLRMSYIVVFIVCSVCIYCKADDNLNKYSARALTEIVRAFELKFADIEDKLDKQVDINREYEDKLNSQETLIEALSMRVDRQYSVLKKCAKGSSSRVIGEPEARSVTLRSLKYSRAAAKQGNGYYLKNSIVVVVFVNVIFCVSGGG